MPRNFEPKTKLFCNFLHEIRSAVVVVASTIVIIFKFIALLCLKRSSGFIVLHAALAPKVRWQFVFLFCLARELILYANIVYESLIHAFYCNLYDFCVCLGFDYSDESVFVCVLDTSTRVVGLFIWAGVEMW